MPRRYPDHPPRDWFAAQLREFHARCGRPSYRRIAEQARLLGQTHPELAGLPVTGFSEGGIRAVLHGRRATLPDPLWVERFVLSCRRLAAGTGFPHADRDVRPEWRMRLDLAVEDARRLGLPVRHATAASLVPRGGGMKQTDVIHLSESNSAHVLSFGGHGRALLARVVGREPQAVYETAILLASDRERERDALSLLTAAAVTGHDGALDLLQDSSRGSDRLNRLEVARHAHELAKRAQAEGDVVASLSFYTCVARLTSEPPRSPVLGDPGDS